MNMPGFTAEHSICKTVNHFQSKAARSVGSGKNDNQVYLQKPNRQNKAGGKCHATTTAGYGGTINGGSSPINPSVIPQLWSWRHRLPDVPEELLPGYRFPFPSPATCDLACGEVRSECYRQGGSQEKCDNAHSDCLMGCFFETPGWP
jgi:hypothetical protein